MSENYYIEIKFEATFSQAALHTVTEALDRAIHENGLKAEDMGDGAPGRSKNFRSWREEDAKRLQSWRENTVPERMERIPEELADEEDELSSESLPLAFSPFCPRVLDLWVCMSRDRSLEVTLSVSHNTMAHVAGYSQDIGFDAAWRATLRDLQHVIDALTRALPVRSAAIPEGLMTWA